MSGATRSRTQHRAHANSAKGQERQTGLSLGELQRARILAGMSTILDTDGVEQTSVTRIVRAAGVPRAAFYQHFTGRDDALRALVHNAVARTRARVLQASEQEIGWQRKTRAGLEALLALYEAEPETGRLCLTHSRQPDPQMKHIRAETLAQLARHLAAGASQGRQPPGALSAQCTVGGVLAVLEARLAEQPTPALTALAGELMSFIVLPYRGATAAREARAAESAAPEAGTDSNGRHRQDPARLRITYRTMRALAAIAADPGLSNVRVGERAGIADQGQISKLLKRLQTLGLVQNTGGGQELGAANAWELTEAGRQLERSILDHHTPARS